MASRFQDVWKSALQAERELLKALAEREPTYAEITYSLSEFRLACQNAIFQNFDAASAAHVEDRLWDAHIKINNRFRKLLARFREANGKKKPVEKRKLEKHYLEFIKLSQRFYRGYIQRLSSHFGDINELEKIAGKFNFDNPSAQPPVKSNESTRKRVLSSCHATLIRLGDLSRYRESELVTTKARNWGPAIGYYDLASVINPASGASHNQLAVIALADGNHLRATYHLYRALSAQEPYPTSSDNLALEFKKIMNAWAKRELIPREDAGIPGKALTPWFIYLHAQCYKGVDFPEHDELENEVMSQLTVDLKERSLEGTLQKFCLINMAAEGFTKVRLNGEYAHNARIFFQRINVKTFFTLLQILLAELERLAIEEPDNKDMTTSPDKVTVVARRILPALRNYSSWLLSNYGILVAQIEEKDTCLTVQIKEFWKIYANTLTLVASTFDVTNLPEVDYLLEEDEEILGFQPLINNATSRRYLDANGQQKPRMLDLGVERNHPNVEMLYRIREFVIDGLDLVVSNRIPVALVDENDRKMFIYQEEGLPSQFYTSPQGHHHSLSSTSVEREDIQQATRIGGDPMESRSVFGGSQSASASMSMNMNRIVEGVERLVESDTCENTPALPALLTDFPPISPAHSFELESSPTPLDEMACKLQTPIPTSKLHSLSNPSPSIQPPYTSRPALPSLPSIWNTDLLPQTADPLAMSPQTRPSTARQTNPPGPGRQQQSVSLSASGGDSGLIPQELTPREIALQNNLLLERQRILDASPTPSPLQAGWASPELASAYARPLWERSPRDGSQYYSLYHQQKQSASINIGNAWANDAFTSSLGTSFFDSSSSALDNTKKSVGVIGQMPPSGQGG